ncbi:hypothetical protein [Peribacillus simplex]
MCKVYSINEQEKTIFISMIPLFITLHDEKLMKMFGQTSLHL